MKSPVIKILTIICFLGLIIAFIAYRTNALNVHEWISVSNQTERDTLPQEDTITKPSTLIPSSKVLIFDDAQELLNKMAKESEKTDSSALQEILMSGSKSVLIPTTESSKTKEKRKKEIKQ